MDALIDIYREVKRTRDGIRPVQHGTDGHPVRLILKQEQLVHNNVNVTGRPDTNRGPGVSRLAVLLQPSLPHENAGVREKNQSTGSGWKPVSAVLVL